MAGISMMSSIALTAGITIALISYLVQKRSEQLALPVTSPQGGDTTSSSNAKPATTKPKRVYMYTLDGMRTILVVCVIFAHYPIGLPAIAKDFLGWPMQFFFVLSGFVAQCQEVGNDSFSWISGLTYVTRRLARILPLYQLALCMEYALAAYSNTGCHPVLPWAINALLLQVFFPVKVCGHADYAWTLGYTHFNGNGQAWFAACIVWFSCLFPLLYNCRPRSGGWWLLGMMLAIFGFRAVPDLVHPTWGTYGGGFHLYAMSPIRLLEYVAGMWAAQVATEAGQKWGSWNGWCWVFDASLVLLVGMIYVSLRILGANHICSGDYHLTAICCLVCIAAKLAAEMPEESRQGVGGALLHRAIGSTPLTYMARFSFAAYIFQTSFMRFIDNGQDFYLSRFVLLWLFSMFACIYIEEPIRLASESRLRGNNPCSKTQQGEK